MNNDIKNKRLLNGLYRRLQINLLHPNARTPSIGTAGSVGLDLYPVDNRFVLQPGELKIVPTGISLEIPIGFYDQIASKSSLVIQHNLAVQGGVIDQDYKGEIFVLLHNFGTQKVSFEELQYPIAQLILIKCGQWESIDVELWNDITEIKKETMLTTKVRGTKIFEQIGTLYKTRKIRGEGKFGSTSDK